MIYALVFWVLAASAQAAIRIGEPVVRVGRDALIIRLEAEPHVVWRSFTLAHPPRLVVDIHGAVLPGRSARWIENVGNLRDIRAFAHRDGMVRLVFDLRHAEPYQLSALPGGLTLSLAKTKGHRPAHVATPTPKKRSHTVPVAASRPKAEGSAAHGPAPRLKRVPLVVIHAPRLPPDIVIAIDPGHGGIDSGACGIDHICEKNVVLRIGRDLAARIDATPGFKAFMTRTGNYYVPLRERVALAEAHHAAAFISIHANSLPEPEGMDVRGAEIFILSQHGVSREARWLAHSENAADQAGDLHFGGGGSFLHNILLNMTQNGTRRASYDLAHDILGQLHHIGPVHIDHVEKANFLVLESPTIPSVLIETAFISNPHEALRLDEPTYDAHIAYAVWAGIMRDAPRLRARLGMPAGPRVYVVRAGETLSGIAARFHVSLAALRAANSLDGVLVAGTSLRIPSG
ncbi:MAG TPA: N-acetylmuramoyl-L-alanine amidase [Acidiferrobacter sp.]|nr:N-acetylmuramoyl-L-alanine amidase [Acidiferrobacter sp.]